MTSVNTNIGALVAAQNLEKTSKELDSAIARLSSGLRINSAKDDAAGMAIASKMESQVKGLSMAIRNGTDSQNLIDTSEGAQVETVNILQRLRELAVQSANDSNTALDRTFINAEATQLIAEVDRIATQTTWNGTNLLDGTFLSKQFQLGSNNGEDVTFSIDSAKSADLGNYRVNGTSTLIDANDDAITAQTLTLSGHIGSTTAAISLGGNAKDVASGVNAVTNLTGITASAVTKVKLHSMTTAGDITFTLGNDASTSPGSAAITATVTDVSDIRSIMTAINAVSGTTGITATVHSDGNSALVLTHSEGEDIKITSFTHSGANLTAHMHVDVLDQDGAAVTEGAGFANSQILNDVTTDDNSLVVAESVAVNTAFTLVSGIASEFNAKLTMTNSAHTQSATASAVIVGTGADGSVLTETLNYSTSSSGSVTSVNTFATITSVTNDAVALTGSSTIIVGQLANTGVDAVGQVRFDSSQAFTVTTDEVDNGEGFLGTTATNTASLSQLSSITLGTVAGSESAIDVIDGAIAKINDQRSDLGAISNRLDATISNLSNIVTNTQSSLSNIKDADFSQETSRLTKAQILSQAATSMLAQANASKQTVLQLLQG
jgi:flagellin